MSGYKSSLKPLSWRAKALIIVVLLSVGGFAVHAYRTGPSKNLVAAAESGDLVAVRAALAAGADVDSVRGRTTGWQGGEPLRRVETALDLAALGGHTEIVRTLLEAGANPNILCTGGGSALVTAAGSRGLGDRTEIIRLLLDAGADPIGPRAHGGSALGWAIVEQHASVPLLFAATQAAGMPADIEKHLLKIAPTLKTDLRHVLLKLLSIDDSESAIHRAARTGTADDLVIVLEAGADPNTRDADGWTPLHWAAAVGGDQARTRILLEAGADPNVATDSGFTPLMGAKHAGDEVRIRMLLDAGAHSD